MHKMFHLYIIINYCMLLLIIVLIIIVLSIVIIRLHYMYIFKTRTVSIFYVFILNSCYNTFDSNFAFN